MPHASEIDENQTPLGEQLLPQLVDSRAKSSPEQLFGLIATSSDATSFQKFTYKAIADAINHVAWWLEESLGRPTEGGQVVAYIGPNDFRYMIMELAGIKVGYVIMVPSLRNSDDNYISLFENTNTVGLIHASPFSQKAADLKARRPSLKVHQIASSAEIFEKSPSARLYPYTKTWAEAKNDQIFICHTSGSTGNPKPIIYTNDWIACIDACRRKPSHNGRQISSAALWVQKGQKMYLGFPLFHLAGLALSVASVFGEGILIFGPETVPVNSKLACDILKGSKAEFCVVPPSIYDDIAKYNQQEFLQVTGHVKTILSGGGPIAPATGDFLTQHVRIAQIYGSTEAGTLPQLVQDPEFWQWFDFDVGYGGNVMEPLGDDEYELVIKRNDKDAWSQPVFKAFPDLDEWRTKDIWRKHPEKNIYVFAGRVDDMLVLSNGEKFNPVGMEHIISSDSHLNGAMIVGMRQPQVGLIVEQKGDLPDAELIDKIWGTVQKGNRASPSHAQVLKHMIAVAKTPFLRTPKMSLIRGRTIKAQQELIDALFSRLDDAAEADSEADSKAPKIKIPLESVQQFVIDCAATLLPEKTVAPSDDFFALGFDSLQTTQLSNLLRSGLTPFLQSAQLSKLAAGLVYSNPTPARLAASLFSLMDPTADKTEVVDDTPARIEALIEKYTANLPARNNKTTTPQTSGLHVILTGSTGYLGHYFLLTLLSNPNVAKVTCFNRSTSAASTYASKGGQELPTSRLEFLQVSFGEPQFGLSASVYQDLIDSADAVIHNAWKVDFNHSVDSYESVHIRGVYNFLTFSLTAAKPVTVSFISSVSTMMALPAIHPGQTVPEHINVDSSYAILGYGQSKYIGERLLDFAAKERGINTVVLRAGQIAGPLEEENGRGMWSKAEWFPTILQSSKALGIIPRDLGLSDKVDWVPVDCIARGAVECLLSAHPAPTSSAYVFNMVNHSDTTWGALVPQVKKSLGVQKEVTFGEWVAQLQTLDASNEQEIARVSALKLVGFYEGIVGDGKPKDPKEVSSFANEKARGSSATFAGLQAINGEVIAKWIDAWGF